jgi:hypothetical protein
MVAPVTDFGEQQEGKHRNLFGCLNGHISFTETTLPREAGWQDADVLLDALGGLYRYGWRFGGVYACTGILLVQVGVVNWFHCFRGGVDAFMV